jgi:YidC/Oxa1 family membrane protein insertase
VTLRPYGSVQQQGVPPDFLNNQIIHEGAIGVLAGKLDQIKWNKWKGREEPWSASPPAAGWGITNKYWLAALVPDQQAPSRAPSAAPRPARSKSSTPATPPAAATARARRPAYLRRAPFRRRQERRGSDRLREGARISNFDGAVDWGNFWFLTRRCSRLLHFFQGLVGNFGLAIMLLTVVVKLLFFPLANKSFESMSKLKKLQPKMEEIKAKHGKDPAKQQQEIMAMYQKEKINPGHGLPAHPDPDPRLVRALQGAVGHLEMRHAPFVGYIRDLSERDPTTFTNLFGCFPSIRRTRPASSAACWTDRCTSAFCRCSTA